MGKTNHTILSVCAMEYFPFEVLFTKPSLIFLFRFYVNVGRDLSSIINPRFLIHSMYFVTRNLEISRNFFLYCPLGLFFGGPLPLNEGTCACFCFDCIHGLCTLRA